MGWALQALVGLPVGMSSIKEWIEALTERFRAEEYEARAAMQCSVQRRERMRAETRQRTEVGLGVDGAHCLSVYVLVAMYKPIRTTSATHDNRPLIAAGSVDY